MRVVDGLPGILGGVSKEPTEIYRDHGRAVFVNASAERLASRLLGDAVKGDVDSGEIDGAGGGIDSTAHAIGITDDPVRLVAGDRPAGHRNVAGCCSDDHAAAEDCLVRLTD